MSNRLSPEKAKAIAAEYILNCYDKRKTLLKCGYSISYVNCSRGMKVFDNILIKSEIARMQAKTQLKADITAAEVIDGLRKIAFPADDYHVSNADKLHAFELLGKTLALYTDNLNTADITKQRELKAEEKMECERISKIRLAEFAEESLKEKAE
jgi:hypothetical protein